MHLVKIEVIINASSGTGHAPGIEARVADAFKASGAEAQISLAASGAEVLSLADRAAKSDAEILVAGGGDGTINSVAAAAVGSNKILGILPFGTMNHFAKDLRIPLNLEGAIDTIVVGNERLIDVGEVNGHIFINNSSLGLYPSIVHKREVQQRLGWGKFPAYIWAALAIMRRYPFLNVRIGVDGKELRSRTPFLFIGNNEYEMEKLNIGSRTHLDKNELSLYMTNRTGRLGLIRLALRALLGGLHQEKDFIALRTREISIETRHKHLRVALDGEVLRIAPPLHYRIRSGALRVMTPARSQVSGVR